MRLFTLICLASLPMVGLAPLSASAQYFEPDPPAAVQEDDDTVGLQGDAASRCAAQFRSFEPDTGYYTTYDGDRVLCPYLQ